MTPSPGLRKAALLGVPVLLAYLNSLAGSFQFDDFNVIVNNPVVHSLDAWWADLGRGIRPMLKLSYAANWMLGPDALGFHLFNVGIHLANTVLVYALTRLLIEGYGAALSHHAPAAAVIAALLFGLHPAQTEAVTYISGRSSSLMATFYLGAMLCYVAASLRERAGLLNALSASLFALALATKESAICLPLALLAWEASRPRPWDWKRVAQRLSMHAIVLVAGTVLLLNHPVYGDRLIPDLNWQTLYVNLLTQIDAVNYLVARLVALYPLNIDPDLRAVTVWSPRLALAAIFLLSLIALGIWALRRRPWWGFGALWFFVQLLPTNTLLPRLDLANDRQLYLAGIGVFVALGVEVELMRARISIARRWVRPLVAALLIAFGGLTALRNLDYTAEIRLWNQTAGVSPHKPRVFNNLAYAYSAAGCLQQAEAAYREALRLNPDYALARENLTSLLERKRSEPTRQCEQSR